MSLAKIFLTNRIANEWNRLPEELSVQKRRMNTHWSKPVTAKTTTTTTTKSKIDEYRMKNIKIKKRIADILTNNKNGSN
jgi:hypothetical protein